jgi:aspartyl-tRNA(Asn)/glutamyl-tRNA(Gln) amidotransferase subunit A
VPGPITKNAYDSALALKAIAGQDNNDSTTVDEPAPDYSSSISQSLAGKKIGVPQELIKDADEKVLDIFNRAIEKMKEAGAEIVPTALPYAKYGIPVYYIITPSEISSNLARFDGIRYGFSDQEAKGIEDIYKKSRGLGFGPEVKRRIMLGAYALSAGYFDAYYLKAQRVRTKIKQELDFELEKLDAIATPTQPDIAFKIGEQSDDPLKMYLEDIFLSPASLAGLPAISSPAGEAEKMPVGIQFIGKRFGEEDLLGLAHNFELIIK